ncbi:GNAT family acetyltransferase [Vibrio sp. qd031]|nr:GNAT family acetyltransferase [Vibrio sp. qd031]
MIYKLHTQLEQMDTETIYKFISQSYWAKDMPRPLFDKALANSRCYGFLDEHGKQVAFARVITDCATFAYLADVFVMPDYRGLGLSKQLVKQLLDDEELQGLRRMMLATKDAHGLYKQFGFEPVLYPEMLMQIWQPGIYQNESAI